MESPHQAGIFVQQIFDSYRSNFDELDVQLEGVQEKLMPGLPPSDFFRINRQCIVHVTAIQEARPEGTQLLLTISVDFPKALYVSQRNTGKFKKWLDGE